MVFQRKVVLVLLVVLGVAGFTASANADTGLIGVGSAATQQWDAPDYSALSVKATTAPAITETAFLQALGSSFDSIDTNHDGVVTYAEALAAFPGLTQDVFYAVDADGNGITEAEVQSATGCAGCSKSAAQKSLSDLFLGALSLTMLAAYSRRNK